MKNFIIGFVCALLLSGVGYTIIDIRNKEKMKEKELMDLDAFMAMIDQAIERKKSIFETLPKEKSEIVFLGDSITDEGVWSELFGNPGIKNRGIGGDVSQGVLDRLDQVTSLKPDKIFLMIGINDLKSGVSQSELLKNYDTILARLVDESSGTRVYVQSILPMNSKLIWGGPSNSEIATVNKEISLLADKYGMTFVDLYSSFIDSEGEMKSAYSNDGLHITGEGYLMWKSIIEEFI